MSNIQKYFGLIALVCLISSCKDDVTSPMVNPCEKSFKADFSIYERVLNGDTLFLSDTILKRNTAVFKTTQQYHSYQWKIGSDVRVFTSSTVSLMFDDSETEIPIQLIVKDTNRAKCPNDDGIDTVRKTLYVLPQIESKLIGTWRGTTTQRPNQELTFSIRYYFARGDWYTAVDGFLGCYPYLFPDSTFSLQDVNLGYKNTDLFQGYGQQGYKFRDCWRIHSGIMRLDSSLDRIHINYVVDDSGLSNGGIRKKYYFTGERVK